MTRNSLSDWIKPDVPGHGLNFFRSAQDVVEEGVLPQLLPPLLPKPSARFEFEAFHQAKEIAGFVEGLEQKMAMVQHDAVGRYGKVSCCGFGLDELQKPTTSRGVRERFAALKAT